MALTLRPTNLEASPD